VTNAQATAQMDATQSAALSCATVAAVGDSASCSLTFAAARLACAEVSASCCVWFWILASNWPAATCWPSVTSTSVTMPLCWKFKATCVAALTFPVALTLDSTTPRRTVAVVVGVLAAAGGPTAT